MSSYERLNDFIKEATGAAVTFTIGTRSFVFNISHSSDGYWWSVDRVEGRAGGPLDVGDYAPPLHSLDDCLRHVAVYLREHRQAGIPDTLAEHIDSVGPVRTISVVRPRM